MAHQSPLTSRTSPSREQTGRIGTVPVDEQHTERAFVTPDREPYEIERREAALVHKYR
jgi:hypothetical protein